MAKDKGNTTDDLPFIRPEVGRHKGGEKAPLVRRAGGRGKVGKRSGVRSRQAVAPKFGHSAVATRRSARLGQRRVVVKARIVKMGSYGKKAARLHARYLERDGAGEGGDKGRFYDQENEGMTRDDIELVKEGEPHHIRLIVSPEDGAALDLTRYTRELMAQVEKDLGRELNWEAVNHYNTDNPHAHVVIHGIDKEGREVYIDREYISNGIRNRARELATNELGERLEHEIQASIEKEIGAKRYTAIDRELEGMASERGVVEFGEVPKTAADRVARARRIGRLQTLESLGLARRSGTGAWHLDGELRSSLQKIDRYEGAMAALSRDLEGHPIARSDYRLFDPRPGDSLSGQVVAKGVSDELYDRRYMVVATADGAAHYVDGGRQAPGFDDAPVGSLVSVEVAAADRFKNADRNIEAFARQRGGVYEPDRHAAEAAVSHEKQSGFAQAHRRRLERLARLGVVEALPGDRWSIPDDFRQRVEQTLSGQAPRLQVRRAATLTLTEQVGYRGRTWIDEQRAAIDQVAHKGFGNELRHAVEKRDGWLRNQGLDPASAKTRNTLDQWEREDLADAWGAANKRAFRALSKGEAFRGELADIHTAASGRRYAIVEDSKEFAMVPWRSDTAAPERGQAMTIGVNADGRTWTKAITKGLSR